MSEPTYSNKRPKMEGAGDAIGSTVSLEIFDPQTQDFEKIRKKFGFVDHTELIKLFFGSGEKFESKKLFIFAPSHFCKSSNMDMIRKFYGRKQDGEVEENYKERYMFQTFKELKIMEKSKDEDLKNHFCAHPVLFVDFKTDSVQSFDDAVDVCFLAIKQAYMNHKAFLNEKLKDGGYKNMCQMWWDATKWQDVGRGNVKSGLATLCDILFKTCKKRVLVLVDECDAVVTGALSNTDLNDKAIEDIAKFMEEVFGHITKGEIDNQLQGVLLTGISYISGIGFSGMIKATPYRFLCDKPESSEESSEELSEESKTRSLIVKYYGLHEQHLRELLTRLEQKGELKKSIEAEMTFIKTRFNGYYSQTGQSILSFWSVLHYLVSKSTEGTYAQMCYVGDCYRKAFADPEVGRLVLELIANKQISIEYVETVTLPKLLRLREGNTSFSHILFSLLLKVGFLTKTEQHASLSSRQLNVMVPNEEIRSIFQEMFKDYEIQIGPFDDHYIKQCALIISNLGDTCLLDDDTEYKTHLKSFHENLVELFKGFSYFASYKLNESMLVGLMWYVSTHAGELKAIPECDTEDNGRADLWLKHINQEFHIVVKLKLCKGKDRNYSSLYALNQMKDEEGQGKINITGLKKKNYLLIGLSMDAATLAPSICVQTSKSEEKTIFVSNTEQEFHCFSNYYKGCYDLINNKHV